MRLKVFPTLIINLFIIFILFFGCKKYDQYPIEPHIDLFQFNKINDITDSTGVDKQGVIGLAYTDGDGDLGLRPNQNTGNFLYNIFVKYYEKKNGKFEEVIITTPNLQTGKPDTLWFNGRIPYLTPIGKSKNISGEIYDTLFINNYGSKYDTIKFQIYIQDRALHKSNIVETPEMVINKKPRKP